MHTQVVEPEVQVVTQAARAVVGKEARRGYIYARLKYHASIRLSMLHASIRFKMRFRFPAKKSLVCLAYGISYHSKRPARLFAKFTRLFARFTIVGNVKYGLYLKPSPINGSHTCECHRH